MTLRCVHTTWTRLFPSGPTDTATAGKPSVRIETLVEPWSYGLIAATWIGFLLQVTPPSVDLLIMTASTFVVSGTAKLRHATYTAPDKGSIALVVPWLAALPDVSLTGLAKVV